MAPFYPGNSNLVIQNEGTILSGATVLNFENGGAIQNGPTISYGGNPLEISDGTIIINPSTEIKVGSGLTLSATESPPNVVQKAFFPLGSGATASLPNVPAAGNLLVFFAYGTEGMYTFATDSTTLFNVSEAGCQVACATLTASGTVNPLVTGISSNVAIGMYEISGWSDVANYGAGALTVTGSGPYTTSETLPSSATQNCMILYCGRANLMDVPTSLMPSTLALDASAEFYPNQSSAEFFRLPSVQAANATISYNNTGNNNGSPYGYIAIAGSSTGVATISVT